MQNILTPPAGSITALATPFTPGGEVDLDAWQRLLLGQRDGGSRGVVVAGSTGEAAALYDVEYDALLRVAVETIGGELQVLAGTGLSNTAKTIEQTRRAAALGADVALVVTPPYVRPTQAGLIAHFTAIADDGALPVVLYNVPGRTGCDLLPDTAAQLCGHPRIVGIKEARSEPERMQALLTLRGDGFAVLSGDDATAARALLAGADGVISVASNALPSAFRLLCALAAAGDADGAMALVARLQPVFDYLNVELNPVAIKALLGHLGIGPRVRLPLLPLSAVHRDFAARTAAAVEQIEQTCRDTLAA